MTKKLMIITLFSLFLALPALSVGLERGEPFQQTSPQFPIAQAYYLGLGAADEYEDIEILEIDISPDLLDVEEERADS